MNVLELHQNGVTEYLFRKGMMSSSMISYINYYQHFLDRRRAGLTYRDTIKQLSVEHKVSETTIKKAVRMLERTNE